MLGLFVTAPQFSRAGYIYDTSPPSWRGTNLSTFQAWGFPNNNQVNVAPTLVNNIYGSPVANISLGAFASGYLTFLPGLGTQTNYWDLGGSGGSIALSIPHLSGLFTEIRFQITYFQAITQPPVISITNSFAAASVLSSGTTVVETVPALGQWLTTATTYLLTPSADVTDYYWIISGGNGSVVESVVVDTRTIVPEPSAVVLLLLGFGALVFNRRTSQT
jgi:hypothetical protein